MIIFVRTFEKTSGFPTCRVGQRSRMQIWMCSIGSRMQCVPAGLQPASSSATGLQPVDYLSPLGPLHSRPSAGLGFPKRRLCQDDHLRTIQGFTRSTNLAWARFCEARCAPGLILLFHGDGLAHRISGGASVSQADRRNSTTLNSRQKAQPYPSTVSEETRPFTLIPRCQRTDFGRSKRLGGPKPPYCHNNRCDCQQEMYWIVNVTFLIIHRSVNLFCCQRSTGRATGRHAVVSLIPISKTQSSVSAGPGGHLRGSLT